MQHCSIAADNSHGDDAKRDRIGEKCSQYMERAEQLKRHLAKKGKVFPHGSTAAKAKKVL